MLFSLYSANCMTQGLPYQRWQERTNDRLMYRKSGIWWAIYSDGYTLTATLRNSMHMFHMCEMRRVYSIQLIEKQSYCMQMNKKVKIYLADLCRKSSDCGHPGVRICGQHFFIHIVKIHTGTKKCFQIPLTLSYRNLEVAVFISNNPYLLIISLILIYLFMAFSSSHSTYVLSTNTQVIKPL